MADIFISYARGDRSKIEPIAKVLEAKGWSVWWDPEIRSGIRFDRLIERELEKARSILVIWSSKSVDSDWVRDEATEGLERNILLSVAIESNLKLPLRFRYIHTEPLIDLDGGYTSPAFNKILSDLSAILGSPGTTEETKRKANKKQELPEETGIIPQKEYKPNQPINPDLDAMVEVPAGEFIYQGGMAAIRKRYLIDIYPVTNQQYRHFIKEGGYQNEQLWTKEGQIWLKEEKTTEPRYWRDGNWNQPKHPVVGICYYEAEAFSRWAGKRLPTEIEWERAARGTDGRKYPWSNEFDPGKCNTSESNIGKTTRVTLFPNGISPVDCYDMAGNVREWTDSWHKDDKIQRVLRGGSWDDNRDYARTIGRSRRTPDRRINFIGFRCVRTQ